MIYILLPIFNEGETIKLTINELRTVLDKESHQIIAVNDGSTDNSKKVLDRLKGPDLTVKEYKVNMNIGVVFATGIDAVMEKANDSDILIIMESDRTSNVKLVPELINQIRNNNQDIVIASRYETSGGYRDFPLARRIFSYIASFLFRRTFPIDHVRDYTIFYRAYKVKILRTAINHFGRFGLIQSKGFVANAELLIKLTFFTKKVVEIPFVYDYGKKKSQSKLSVFRTINEYFVALMYLKQIERKIKQKLYITTND